MPPVPDKANHNSIKYDDKPGCRVQSPRSKSSAPASAIDCKVNTQPHSFLIFNRDAKLAADVVSAVRDMGNKPTRTAFRSPWRNGVAERWMGSCRRDLLDHVIMLNERHLKRLMSSYLRYYHEDRTHLGLAKDTPAGRPTEIRSAREGQIQSLPRLGALHHRYAIAA